MERRINELEKRIAALEVEAQKRHQIDVDELSRKVSENIAADLNRVADRAHAGVYGDIPE